MTTPVYMKQEEKGSMMEFVLPSKFNMDNVSMPKSQNVEVYLDEGGHYASIQYGVILTTTNAISIRKL